ncbi:uncharacterized protein DUF998 [Herbihabitans rhizosphaerae]|uniref:Uncharacterized protein DUF998 n=2 Tax=Herbihabitans rhizosphaerae TaxID=1872711 RepID=A0A4Q7L2N9_9PSEU|nr:uncharacterized protein DUF998 [Herbihabitans rhizosphaerae]
MVILHLINDGNPMLDTLSSYAFQDNAPQLLATSMLSMAIGSLTLLGALSAARIPLNRTTKILFGCWIGGLTAAAIFRARFSEYVGAISGDIHQYSCLVAFISVPAIGYSILDRLRDNAALSRNSAILARWTRYSTACLLLFGISYLCSDFPDTPIIGELAELLPVGLVQRVALVVDICLLGALLLIARAASSPSFSARQDPPVPVLATEPHSLVR